MRLYASIYIVAYVLLLATLFVLPLFSFEGTSIFENTLSELGAQKAPGNWFANMTIVVLSFAIVLLATKQLRTHWLQLAALYFFCMSFLLTGVYQLAGLDAHEYIFNYTDDALHSLFSVIAGFAFCLFCVFFNFIVKEKAHKWQTLGALLLTLIAPILMWQYPEYRGLFHRVLFLGTFGWLFYALTSYRFHIKNKALTKMRRYNKMNE